MRTTLVAVGLGILAVFAWVVFVLPEGGRDEIPPLGDIGAATGVIRADVALGPGEQVTLTDVVLVESFRGKGNPPPPPELIESEPLMATNISRGEFEGEGFLCSSPIEDPTALLILYAHDVQAGEPAGSLADVTNRHGLSLADSIGCVRDRLDAPDEVAALIELAERYERVGDDQIREVVSRCE